MRLELASSAENAAVAPFISHWPGNDRDPGNLAEHKALFTEVIEQINAFLSPEIGGPTLSVAFFSSFARMSHIRSVSSGPIILVDLTQVETLGTLLAMSVSEERPAFSITYFLLLFEEYIVMRGGHSFVAFVRQRLMSDLDPMRSAQGYIARPMPAEEQFYEWKIAMITALHQTAGISIIGHEIGHLCFRDTEKRDMIETLVRPLIPELYLVTSFKWDTLYYTGIEDRAYAAELMDTWKVKLAAITTEEIYADLVQAGFVLAAMAEEELSMVEYVHLFSVYFFSELLEVIDYFSGFFAKGKHKLRSSTSQFSVRSHAIISLIRDFDKFSPILPLAPDAMESARRTADKLAKDDVLTDLEQRVHLKDHILNLVIGLPSLKMMREYDGWQELALMIGKQDAIDSKSEIFGYTLKGIDIAAQTYSDIVRTTICFGYAYEWLRDALADFGAVFEEFAHVDAAEVEQSMYEPWNLVRNSQLQYIISRLNAPVTTDDVDQENS